MVKSATFQRIKELVNAKDVLISSHGYDELAEDGILVSDIMDSVCKGFVLEDYPDFGKGPCCLVLQYDNDNKPLHAVWGLSVGTDRPAVLITAYRPDPGKWSDDFRRRNDVS